MSDAADRAARALRRLSIEERIAVGTFHRIAVRGLAVRTWYMHRGRWRVRQSITDAGMCWLLAYDEAPFGIELPGKIAE